MEIKLEAKTLAIGVLLGVVIVIALGADNSHVAARGGSPVAAADKTDYGLSVSQDGLAVVRTQNGDFFVVNPKTAMATRVLHSRRLSDEPSRGRDSKGRFFNFSTNAPVEEIDKGAYDTKP